MNRVSVSAHLTSVNVRLLPDNRKMRRAASTQTVDTDLYRAIFDHVGDAVFVVDPAAEEFIDVNEQACEMLGYSHSALMNLGPLGVHPHEVSEWREFINTALLDTTVRTNELSCRTVNGELLPTEVIGTAIEIDGKECVIFAVRDISERKRIQREGSVLAEIGVVLGSTLAIEEIYEQFADQVQKLIPSDRIVISDVDIDAWTITPVYVAGLQIDGWAPDTPRSLALTPLEDLVRNQTLLVMDIWESERLAQAHVGLVDGLEAGLGSGLAVPLIARDSTVGILSLRRLDPHGYTPREVELAGQVANQIAPAIENARLYKQAGVLAAHEERNRLARDLHDSVTQTLYSLTLHSEASNRLAEAGDLERAQAHLEQMGESAHQALKEMRLLVYQLRPPALEDAGLINALQHRLDAVEERSGVRARLILDREYKLPARIENALFPVAIEALNNAIKHANASTLEVRISSVDGGIELTVEDNGRGFDETGRAARGGVGMASMSERMRNIDGRLSVESVVGEGTTVRAFFELDTSGSVLSNDNHPGHQEARE